MQEHRCSKSGYWVIMTCLSLNSTRSGQEYRYSSRRTRSSGRWCHPSQGLGIWTGRGLQLPRPHHRWTGQARPRSPFRGVRRVLCARAVWRDVSSGTPRCRSRGPDQVGQSILFPRRSLECPGRATVDRRLRHGQQHRVRQARAAAHGATGNHPSPDRFPVSHQRALRPSRYDQRNRFRLRPGHQQGGISWGHRAQLLPVRPGATLGFRCAYRPVRVQATCRSSPRRVATPPG